MNTILVLFVCYAWLPKPHLEISICFVWLDSEIYVLIDWLISEIPDSLNWIPDSKRKRFLDSRFYKQKLPGFWKLPNIGRSIVSWLSIQHGNGQHAGFYLGYSRGRSFPPQNAQLSPQQNLLSLRYIVGNYIGKIIQTRQGHCTHCNISQSCVSKCTRLHLSAYSFHIISGAACPGTPLGSSMPSATQDFSPKK